MLDRRTFRHVLAALGFLAGQWLLFLHATQHQLNAADHTPCEICTIAHAAGPAAAAPSLPDAPAAESFVAIASTRSSAPAAQVHLPPGRAPPPRFA